MKMMRQNIINLIFLAAVSLMVTGQGITFNSCTTNSDCSATTDRCVSLQAFPGVSLCLPDRGSVCTANTDCRTTGLTCAGPEPGIKVCGGCANEAGCTTTPPTSRTKCDLTGSGATARGVCVECQTDADCTARDPNSFCDANQQGTIAIPSQPFFNMTCNPKVANGQPCRRDVECFFPGVTCSTTTHTCAGDTLPNLRVDGALCNVDTECRSGICRGSIRRVCGLRLDGMGCQGNAECQNNNCTGNICVSPGKADGERCFSGSECASRLCLFRTSSGVRQCGPLPLREIGARCNNGRDCASGRCSGRFFNRRCAAKVPVNGECLRTQDCQNNLSCEKVQGLGINQCMPIPTTMATSTQPS